MWSSFARMRSPHPQSWHPLHSVLRCTFQMEHISEFNSQQDVRNFLHLFKRLRSYLVCGCITMCLSRPFDGLLDGFQTWFYKQHTGPYMHVFSHTRGCVCGISSQKILPASEEVCVYDLLGIAKLLSAAILPVCPPTRNVSLLYLCRHSVLPSF